MRILDACIARHVVAGALPAPAVLVALVASALGQSTGRKSPGAGAGRGR